MGRLLGMSGRDVQSRRLPLAREFARRHRCHLVLKGHRTLVATPEGRVHVNPTGNPGMATGGARGGPPRPPPRAFAPGGLTAPPGPLGVSLPRPAPAPPPARGGGAPPLPPPPLPH